MAALMLSLLWLSATNWAIAQTPVSPPKKQASPQPSSTNPLSPLAGVNEPEQSDSTAQEYSEEEQDYTSETQEPKTNSLEPTGSDIDTVIKTRINQDLWDSMKGDLPCLAATRDCISLLQSAATQHNPLLTEIDQRIEEINIKIEEARAINRKSIKLSVLTPAVQALLQPQIIKNADGKEKQTGGLLSNIASLFINPAGTLDKLLNAVGIPILQASFGGNQETQRNAIAISDLQVKVAELQRGRAELAQKIREQVYLAAFEYDETAREFQISQEVALREAARVQLLQAEYSFGEGDTNSYLNNLNSADGKKAQTYHSWSAMRSRIEKIKLLVLGVDE
jgi:hypothetical protein